MKHYEEKGCNVDLLVWCKTNPIPTCNNKYLSDLEKSHKQTIVYLELGGTYKTKSKYFISSANVEDKGKYQHPCCKPIEMLSNFIINSTNEGDVVLDCFMGSGSVMVAAKRLNRKYIGFEIEEKWYKVAKDRLQGIDQNGNMNLFDIPTD